MSQGLFTTKHIIEWERGLFITKDIIERDKESFRRLINRLRKSFRILKTDQDI